jgi:hypothetical protein
LPALLLLVAGLFIACVQQQATEPECSRDADCDEGFQCLQPPPCGLNPPFTPCDDAPSCVDCRGADAEGNGCDIPLPEEGDPCGDASCGSSLACVEPTAREGGSCRALPAACEADPCACPLDELAPLCEGQRPNDCLDRFVACEGAYPRQ